MLLESTSSKKVETPTVMAFANTKRRTFRGRGGARDGSLPHSLSRKNRVARREARQISNALANNRRRDREQQRSRNAVQHDDTHHSEPLSDNIQNGNDAEVPAGSVSCGDDMSTEELKEEILHLKRRIRNMQESIQLSNAIVNPATWEQNCLNAVHSCVVEWHMIVSFHYCNTDGDAKAISAELLETGHDTCLSVFVLIQMALQSGPLVGSNPGYFKRCGGEVARIALKFLTSEVFTGDLATKLLFTDKQIAVIQKWTKNAEKAAKSNKPPSRSMTKFQKKEGDKLRQKKGKEGK